MYQLLFPQSGFLVAPFPGRPDASPAPSSQTYLTGLADIGLLGWPAEAQSCPSWVGVGGVLLGVPLGQALYSSVTNTAAHSQVRSTNKRKVLWRGQAGCVGWGCLGAGAGGGKKGRTVHKFRQTSQEARVVAGSAHPVPHEAGDAA